MQALAPTTHKYTLGTMEDKHITYFLNTSVAGKSNIKVATREAFDSNPQKH